MPYFDEPDTDCQRRPTALPIVWIHLGADDDWAAHVAWDPARDVFHVACSLAGPESDVARAANRGRRVVLLRDRHRYTDPRWLAFNYPACREVIDDLLEEARHQVELRQAESRVN